ncbi:hypothetical protein KHQ81_00900 [Mycoplasmatota bacterium]|nr:hypothetical protein KHQ81_00900 [Mycoplasmatota bacterium]
MIRNDIRKNFELANHYSNTGKFKESEELYKLIIEDGTNDYGAYVNLANLYRKYGKSLEAYEVSLAAREKYGPDLLIDQFIYFYFLDIHDYVAAEDMLLDCLELDPNDSSMLIRYADLLIITGCKDKDKIKYFIEKAIENDPNNNVVLQNCINFYSLKLKYLKDLNFLLEQFFESQIDEFNKYYTLGLVEYEKRNYKQSYEYYYNAFMIRPNNQTILYLLNELKFKKSKFYILRMLVERFGGTHLYYGLLIVLSIVCDFIGLSSYSKYFLMITAFITVYWLITYLIISLSYKKLLKENH